MLKLLSKYIAVWSVICDDSTYMWTCIIKAENSFSLDVIYYTHNVGIVSKHPIAIFHSKYTQN